MIISARIRLFLSIVFCIFLISGCGDDMEDGNLSSYGTAGYETGLLNFSINIHPSFTKRTDARIMMADLQACKMADIDHIMVEVYDNTNSIIAVGGPWPCDAQSGIVENVPVGRNYKVAILCLNDKDEVTYKGFKDNITVFAGKATRLGTIDTYFFIPSLISALDGSTIDSDSLVFRWEKVPGAIGYHLIVFEAPDFLDPVIDDITTKTVYTPMGLSENATYYWQVFAIDPTGNEGTGSDIWSVVVEPGEPEPHGDCEDGDLREVTCGDGLCMSSVVQICEDGIWRGEDCMPGLPVDEICDDQLDNDCDGDIDSLDDDCWECTPGAIEHCETGLLGECAAGTRICGDDGFYDGCVQDILATDEICDDQLDNDCDGDIDLLDEDCWECTPGATEECETGLLGECAAGTRTCGANGFYGDCVQNNPVSSEICDDQLDNDCDGSTDIADEECWECIPGATISCATGNLGECAAGTRTCGGNGFYGECIQDNQASDEICDDQVDNDCDGYADTLDEDCWECTPGTTASCDTGLLGECAAGTRTCGANGFYGECVQDNPVVSEICDDQLDNDCDGFTDIADEECWECTPGATVSCDTGLFGACAAGTRTCGASGFYGDCIQDTQASDEICDDQLDNDCDGNIDTLDEDCWECSPGTTTSCDTGLFGECAAGTRTCGANGFYGDCVQDTQTSDEICDDQLDNDCDGYIDALDEDCWECAPGTTASCDTGLLGVCAAGTRTCGSNGFYGNCVQDTLASDEFCDDQLDNDCDGNTDILDEDCWECTPGTTASCDTGLLGVCAAGTRTCGSNGFYGNCIQDTQASDEFCDDQLDNDCDGNTDTLDEDCWECTPGTTESCDTGLFGECAAGIRTCGANGFYGNCIQDIQASDEICDDQLDNDCDGNTDTLDEDCWECSPGTTTSCDTGLFGECAAGIRTCGANGFFGDCIQDTQASDEICDDQLDNDCDGNTDTLDEDCWECSPGTTTSCDTGLFGECAAGTRTCGANGFYGDCIQDDQASDEICDDQLDNDCDGYIDALDEDCWECSPGTTASCDTGLLGECAAGTQTCGANGFYGDCIQDTQASDEICDDQLDNDCDGYIDALDEECWECTPGATVSCDTGLLGECAAGTQTCGANGFYGDCIQDNPAISEECGDLLDNDCDGYVDALDEECWECTPEATISCETGLLGECAAGTRTCGANGFYGDCVQDTQASDEICDDELDNDCDGYVDTLDEECWECTPGTTASCDTGLLGECAAGTLTCGANGFYGNCVQTTPASDEICDDQLDNDCDGFIDTADEDCWECIPGTTASCETGLLGVCAAGTQTCGTNGFYEDCVQDIQASDEICDDQLDNDCDGYVDTLDEECWECTPGTTASCDTGLLGVCAAGTRTCGSNGFYGDCVQDYQASDEICDDQLDNDCDGYIDTLDEDCWECSPGTTTSCDTGLLGVCAAGTRTCGANGFYGDCVQGTQASDEICDDQLDNDCDGFTDALDEDCWECTPETTASCETGLLGVCAAGTLTCGANGFYGDCIQDNQASDEICSDQLDNDCDGYTDALDEECWECTPGTTVSCGTGLLGICAAGTQTCGANGFYGDCVQNNQASDEICNDQLDNDCDGYTDALDEECWECTPGTTASCDTGLLGVCAAGTQTCGENGFYGNCVQTTPASDEICDDQLDNDCDGYTDALDEECWECTPGTTASCETGLLGVCAAGTQTCGENGFYGDCIQVNQASDEICDDQLDNDCDGDTDALDEECWECTPGTTASCETGLLGVCAAGTRTCGENGFYGNCVQTTPASDEICDDQLDNDCDGYTDALDEECWECTPGTTASCETGLLGVCAAGSQTCGANGFYGDCIQNNQPSDEVCDNLDNDCNGETDENTVSIPNVIDIEESEAISTINAVNGLSVGDITYECSTLSAGHVISQDPVFGSGSCDTWVDLVISNGQPTVPNVVGMTVESAIEAIDNTPYLVHGTISYACSNTVPQGNVISQDPGPGTADCSTTVDLVISAGQPSVPSVVDLTVEDAIAAIENTPYLSLGNVTYECSDTVPDDIVIGQNPQPGQTDCETIVDLVVSAGQPYVPDVTGQSEQTAITMINAVDNLSIGNVTYACSNTVDQGNVISQDPDEGYAPCNSTVNLVVSTGQPVVPNVVDMTEEAAINAIDDEDNINVGDISSECSDTVPEGDVIRQIPDAGPAECDTYVSLVISDGQPNVPDLVGMGIQSAIEAIDNTTYLSHGNITLVCSNTVPADTVISQDPAAGPALCGTTVDLTVSNGFCSTVIYVDQENGSPNYNGRSWAQPKATFQDAIAVANDNDQIWVREGTYLLSPDVGEIQVDKHVEIYGGFPSDISSPVWEDRDWESNITIVDGQGSVRCFYLVTETDVTIDGLIIQNGYITPTARGGGGIYCELSTPTIRNCIIRQNNAVASAGFGAGLYNYYCDAIITNCSFEENTANGSTDGHGAGIYNYYSDAIITDCHFTGNTAFGSYSNYGGGIYNNSSSPTITNCIFESNSTGGESSAGAGIYNNQGSPKITSCIFNGNSAGGIWGRGGGISNLSCNPTIVNCLFFNNSANGRDEGLGGGIYNYSGNPIITNCSFSKNSTSDSYDQNNYGGGIYNASSSPTITNCILWENVAAIDHEIHNSDDSQPAVRYCNVEGGYSGTGNINTNPLFVNSQTGDFHLQQDSPCIDTGTNNASALPDLDFEGDSRMLDGDNDGEAIVDMGVDERDIYIPPPVLITPLEGAELDNNCQDYSDSIEWSFDWSDVTGATKYQIYVIGPSAAIPLIDDDTVTSSSYYFSYQGGYIGDASRSGWTWRVRAGNNNDEWGEWSEIRSFDVERLNTDCPLYTFSFDNDNEQWRALGFYHDGYIDPIEGYFSDSPAPWSDNLGSGAIGVVIDSMTLPDSDGGYATFHLNSVDLENQPFWQDMSLFTYDVTGAYMKSEYSAWIEGVIMVRKPDGTETYYSDFEFHPISIGSSGWETHSLNITQMELEEGSTILNINLRIFFVASQYYSGYIYIDNVSAQ